MSGGSISDVSYDPTPVDNAMYTIKRSMVRVQYCSEWTELGYGMARLFDSFFQMIDSGTTSIVCRMWPRGTRTRVVRVYYPPQELIIDWFLEIRHKWEST